MKKSVQRALVIVLALALVAGIFVPAVAATIQAAMAVSQSEIDQLEEEQDEINQQIQDLENQLAALAGDKSAALERKELLDQQIDALQAEINATQAIITALDGQIAQKETEIAELEAQEAEQYDLFCQRVRAMEETGSVSYLAILFNASSFEEFLDQAMLVTEIMDYDNAIIDALQATRQQLESAKTDLETARADQEDVKAEQESAKAQLDTQRAQADALVQEILSQESEYQATLNEIEAEEERIQAEIVRKSEELARQQAEEEARRQQEQQQAQNNGSSSGGSTSSAALGGYIWPVNSRRITSPFGSRNTGIAGASTNHKGVDIGGVYYSSVVRAAKAGTVIVSTYSSSYGNYVVVSHGAGNTTLYAHMSSRSVSVGDVVAQGDQLGITGSTGISSGPHLHFEITENGVRVNPLQYLTGYIQAW